MNEKNHLLFISSLECPFAQRTWIALEEKNADYETRHIQLRTSALGEYAPEDKPEWFLEMNPLGKVPVLRTTTGETLYESAVCNEFLEDVLPDPPLLPDDSVRAGRARLAIARFNEHFVPNFYKLLLKSDPEDRKKASTTLHRELDWLTQKSDSSGPWFLGNFFSLADCAIVPFLLRLPVLNYYRNFESPTKLIEPWTKSAPDRGSINSTLKTPDPYDGNWDDYMLDVYQSYAERIPKSTSARDYA